MKICGVGMNRKDLNNEAGRYQQKQFKVVVALFTISINRLKAKSEAKGSPPMNTE